MRSRWAKEEAPPARGTDGVSFNEPYLEGILSFPEPPFTSQAHL